MTITEQYELGLPIFKKIFNLPSAELKKTVAELLGDEEKYEDIFENGNVYKSTQNDEPESLKISSWGTIDISPLGIYYKPEHGSNEKIFTFTKFTVIP